MPGQMGSSPFHYAANILKFPRGRTASIFQAKGKPDQTDSAQERTKGASLITKYGDQGTGDMVRIGNTDP